MSSGIGTHLRHNFVGYVAIFMSLTTGTAWALGVNSVTTRHIKDDTIQSVDMKNGGGVKGVDVANNSLSASDLGPLSAGLTELDPAAFASGDIAPQSNGFGISPDAIQSSEIEEGQVTGSDVAGNTLTGSDILESSLSDVPGATTARNVNGVNAHSIEFLAGPNSGTQTVLPRTQGFELRARCDSEGDLEVFANTDRNARLLSWSIDVGGSAIDNTWALESFTTSGSVPLVFWDDGDQSGQTVYMTSQGGVVIVNWVADNNTSPSFGTQCAFVGTATSH